MYVLDTNILIYYFKRRGRIADNLACLKPGEAILSTIVLYELQVGLEKAGFPARRVTQIQTLLADPRLVTVVFDREAAEAAASIRAGLESQGQPIGAIDVLIAGVAMSRNATLVTHNTREFSRVPSLDIVDWF